MARKRKHHEDPESPDTEVETPDTELDEADDTPESENHVGDPTPHDPVIAGGGTTADPAAGAAPPETPPPSPDLARPGGEVISPGASYHPNEEMGRTTGDALPTMSAPLLDADTHDFGPTGGEERCRKCGKTREEIGLKVGRKLTNAELNHPHVKDGPLLPPRIR